MNCKMEVSYPHIKCIYFSRSFINVKHIGGENKEISLCILMFRSYFYNIFLSDQICSLYEFCKHFASSSLE